MIILNEILKGKKTYLVALALGVLTAAHYLGYIDTNVYNTLVGLLGATAMATIRSAIGN